ncbi:MAG: hypothetical protein BRD44_06450 [Bacteroidetes bacterium QS_7_67_15]|nr:MAG: hypothetical protein BRD44_06450 [Bacteroidetes bacterium QS_7_67_15]
MTSLPLRRFAFALVAAVLTLALAAAPAPVQAQTLEPLDDTHIREEEGSTTNGDSTTLVVKYDPGATRHAYYKFDLSGIADGSLPDKVFLSVYHIIEEGETAQPTDAVFGLDDVDWKEGTASYNNPPGGTFGAEDTGVLDDTTYKDAEAKRFNFDVTSRVRSQLDAGADSVTFKQVQESGDEFVGFSSKENSDGNAPKLRINPVKQVTIDISNDGGDPTGWRMLATPVGGITVGDLANETLVQGVPNMKYSDHDPNLHESYDGSGDGYYPVPGGPDATPAAGGAGQGFYWYFFEKSEADVPENAGLPFSWTPGGIDRTSDVTVSVEPTGQNFFMLGNPYRPAYDLSGLNLNKDGDGDGTQDFSNIVQVWNLDKGSDGGYVSLDRTNSDVATGQGFFVERNDQGNDGGLATELTFTAGDTTDGGTATFYGGDGRQTGSSTSSSQSAPIASASSGEGPRRVQLRVTSRDDGGTAQSSSSATLYLTEGATRGADAYEATALGAMAAPYVTLAYERTLTGGETALLSQASLPRALSEKATLPLRVETAGLAANRERAAGLDAHAHGQADRRDRRAARGHR